MGSGGAAPEKCCGRYPRWARVARPVPMGQGPRSERRMAEEPIALGYYAAVLRRHSGLILGAGLATGLLAAVALGTARYEATAEVLIRPLNSASSPEIESERNVSTATERQIARSVDVAVIAAE